MEHLLLLQRRRRQQQPDLTEHLLERRSEVLEKEIYKSPPSSLPPLIIIAITAINARLDQHDQFNAELQQAFQGQQEEQTENNEDITIEDLLTLSPEQISQLVAVCYLCVAIIACRGS